jgi:DNA-binding LytR/AlgR family response regulator
MDPQKRPRVLIADDEPALADRLVTSLRQLWPEAEVAAVVHDGPAARDAISRLGIDVAFLDIRMPGLTGLQVAREARNVQVVFFTAYDQHAMAAFETAAVDYLLKPIDDARLAQTIVRLRGKVVAGPSLGELTSLLQGLLAPPVARLGFVQATLGAETHIIDVETVLFFRSAEKYTSVQTATREYLIRTPLKELLPQLDPAKFWQIHRNAIVNIRAVASTRREFAGQLVLKLNGHKETLQVSRAFAHRFRQS